MKILIVTTAHHAGDTRITYRQAQSLAKQHDVILLAQSTSRLLLPDTINYEFIRRSDNIIVRVFCAFLRMIRIVISSNIDLILIHDPELIPLILFFDSFGITCIVDHHENYEALLERKSYSASVTYLTSSLLALNKLIIAHHAALNLTATRSIFKSIEPFTKQTLHFPNYAGKLDLADIVEPSSSEQRDIDLIYVGYGSEQRGILALLDIQHYVYRQHGIQLNTHIAGTIRPHNELKKAQHHPGWSLVTYHGFTSRPLLDKFLHDSKIGICPYFEDEHHKESMPNKIFEYAWKGCAIVAHHMPHWRFIEQNDMGLLVNFTNTDAAANAIIGLLRNRSLLHAFRLNGYKKSRTEYSYQSIEQNLLHAIDHLHTNTQVTH